MMINHLYGSFNFLFLSFRYYACLCGHHELVEFLLQNGEVVLIANRFNTDNTGFVTTRSLSKWRRTCTWHTRIQVSPDMILSSDSLVLFTMSIIADTAKLATVQPRDAIGTDIFFRKLYESQFSSLKDVRAKIFHHWIFSETFTTVRWWVSYVRNVKKEWKGDHRLRFGENMPGRTP